MILVTIRVRLPRAEDPAWARPSIIPNQHGFIEANNPCREEYRSHVLVEGRQHLPDLPKLISKGRWCHVGNAKVPFDAIEPPPGHVAVESVGTWTLVGVVRSGVPKIILRPPAARRHEQP